MGPVQNVASKPEDGKKSGGDGGGAGDEANRNLADGDRGACEGREARSGTERPGQRGGGGAGGDPANQGGGQDDFQFTLTGEEFLDIFFEDLERNLKPAHAMGFATVLVHSNKDWSHEPVEARPAGADDADHPHVDYLTDDLTGFLQGVLDVVRPEPFRGA